MLLVSTVHMTVNVVNVINLQYLTMKATPVIQDQQRCITNSVEFSLNYSRISQWYSTLWYSTVLEDTRAQRKHLAITLHLWMTEQVSQCHLLLPFAMATQQTITQAPAHTHKHTGSLHLKPSGGFDKLQSSTSQN